MSDKQMTFEGFRDLVVREIIAALEGLNAKGIKCGPIIDLEIEWVEPNTYALVDPRKEKP